MKSNQLNDNKGLHGWLRNHLIKLKEIDDDDDDDYDNTWRIKHALISTVRDIGTS